MSGIKSPDREFQVFVKPVGQKCNLNCSYCYYLNTDVPGRETGRMKDGLLEEYIRQHIEASSDKVIFFSWHGGEPTLAGLDFYRKAVDIQKRLLPVNRSAVNGIQTNGTLIDDGWCSFLAAENFFVGISIDGTAEMHDKNRIFSNGSPSFAKTLSGYENLKRYGIATELLCVVNSENVKKPVETYRFLKNLGTEFISFLPLVERIADSDTAVSERTVPADEFGNFLCAVFDEWEDRDIGKVKIQIIEEALRTAFSQDHTLCIFKRICGGVPVVEANGDFYSCDHFVDSRHKIGNINETHIAALLESERQIKFGKAKQETLPQYCTRCEVLDMCNGECPKNRFIAAPGGEPGLNYLCAGYRRFFNHIGPFAGAVADEWRRR